MKKRILSFIFLELLILAGASAVVSAIGMFSHWITAVQFSNGFFFGGAILMLIGFINIIGSKYQESPGLSNYNPVNRSERDFSLKLLMQDAARGQSFMALMGTAGALMFFIAWILTKG